MIDVQLAVLDKCVTVLRKGLEGGKVLDHQSLSTLLDSTDDLQELHMKLKYVQFDLEATRRENQYLRKLLENS